MKRIDIKRQVDYQMISEWVVPKSRVLDLGCGRGFLLEKLKQERRVYGVGVDNNAEKISSCITRGITVYQGDMLKLLKEFRDQSFDWVICSSTVHELSMPVVIIQEALRVGKRLAMGFINYGFWLNRLSLFWRGHQVLNEVYPLNWQERSTANPVSIKEFESFCKKSDININRAIYFDHSWQKICHFWPQLFSGYALYELSRPQNT